jgi:hypothetical protein
MIGSGVYEVEIDGEKVGFEFCMLSEWETEEAAGMSIRDVFKKIAQGRQKYIAYWFMGGAIAYNQYNGIDKKVDLKTVARYIEKMGEHKALEIYTKAIAAPIEKNGKAPATTAGQEQ